MLKLTEEDMNAKIVLPRAVDELERRHLIRAARYAIRRLRRIRKDLGQNFVINPRLVREIVSLVNFSEDTRVLEIGSGHGVLTIYVAQRTCHLVGVEISPRLVTICREIVSSLDIENVDIVLADALTLNWNKFTTVVSNLPFSITSDVLVKLIRDRIRHAILTVQTEVADRLIASPGTENYGRLTVLVQCFYAIRKVLKVDSRSFMPEPEVTATLVELRLRDVPCINVHELPLFEKFTNILFSQRNKVLRKVLRETLGVELDRHALCDKRVYQLSIPELVTLFFEVRDLLTSLSSTTSS